MQYANTVSKENVFPLFYFDDDSAHVPDEAWYKIYHDGGHYVGSLVSKSSQAVSTEKRRSVESIDILFDSLYFSALKKNLNDEKKKGSMTEYIKSGILELFPDYENLDEYIAKKIKRKYHNLGVRKKRFRRKAYLNRWNYFVTFTFSDKLHTAETFRKKLRRCLSNLKTRRNWRYMGVFEYSPEKGRLHFHALLYVPNGEMIGRLYEKKDYSTAQGKMQVTHENSFFAENFGRNDFTEISGSELKHGHSLDYMIKYMEKQGERVVYSRGIPSEICRCVNVKDICSDFYDFVLKVVLFDDVITWENDVMNVQSKQLTIADLICNPSLVA